MTDKRIFYTRLVVGLLFILGAALNIYLERWVDPNPAMTIAMIALICVGICVWILAFRSHFLHLG